MLIQVPLIAPCVRGVLTTPDVPAKHFHHVLESEDYPVPFIFFIQPATDSEFKGFRINHLCGNGVQSISELESGVVTAGFVSFCI